MSYVFLAFYLFLLDFSTSALAQLRRLYFAHTDSGCTLMGYRIWERKILSKAYCSSRMLILKSWSFSAESSREIFKECVFNAQKAKIDANLNHILKLFWSKLKFIQGYMQHFLKIQILTAKSRDLLPAIAKIQCICVYFGSL